MKIQLLYPFEAAAEEPFGLNIRTADQEILAVFDDMGVIVIGRVTPVAYIDDRRPAAAGGINHLAESAVFIAFSAGLNDEVGEAFVQNGVERIYIGLVITFGGFGICLKKSVRVIRVTENVQGRTVTGNKLVLSIKKIVFESAVEGKEKAPQRPVLKLLHLLIKSGF